jgi:pimeloyl-ACP methyl ester carboxylesterase
MLRRRRSASPVRRRRSAKNGANVGAVAHALTGSARVIEWWDRAHRRGGAVRSGALVHRQRQRARRLLRFDRTVVAGGRRPPLGAAVSGRYRRRHGRGAAARLRALGIARVAIVIGGSLGGQQALQWARGYDDAVDHAIVVGTYDHLRAQGIAQNGVAREAIRLDPKFAGGWYEEPPVGRAAPRARDRDADVQERGSLRAALRTTGPIAHGGDPSRSLDDRFDVEGYLAHQGDVFVDRYRREQLSRAHARDGPVRSARARAAGRPRRG